MFSVDNVLNFTFSLDPLNNKSLNPCGKTYFDSFNMETIIKALSKITNKEIKYNTIASIILCKPTIVNDLDEENIIKPKGKIVV